MRDRVDLRRGLALLAALVSLALLAAAQPPPRPPAAAAAAAPGAPAAAVALAAANPPAADGETFGEAIEVTVVDVDVVVRDKKTGQQVSGLTRDDFTLSVDGKKVDITNFAHQTSGEAAPPNSTPTAPPASNAAPPSPAAAADAAAQRERLSLVVFVDNLNMRPFDRNRILKQVRGFLQSTVQRGDQVMLVSHDLGLDVRHSFRDGAESLLPALDALDKEVGQGLSRDNDLRSTMDQIADTVKQLGCSSAVDQVLAVARAHQEQVLADIKSTYSNLHNLMRSLGGLEGRKALLYVGDGLATQVGTDVYGQIEELCPNNAFHTTSLPVDATAPMRQVILDANANRVTLYTLEARGLPTYVSAEHPGKPLMSFDLARRVEQDRQDSLLSLARETGGRAAIDGNDFRHDLEQIAGELASSYSLGFAPPAAAAGRVHTIKVEMNRPGLTASYRSSYRDRSAGERLEGAVEAVLLHGQVDNPLSADLKVSDGAATERNRVTVPVTVRVPFGKLTFVPREDGRHGHVTIFVGNLDNRGGSAPIQHVQVPLRIPEADAKRVLASRMGYDLKVVVAPGRQRLAVVVRDDVARVASSLVQEIDVDKSGAVAAVAAAAAAKSNL